LGQLSRLSHCISSQTFYYCRDNDAHGKENVGKREAEKPRHSMDVFVLLPRFEKFSSPPILTDLHVAKGWMKVRRQLNVEPKVCYQVT